MSRPSGYFTVGKGRDAVRHPTFSKSGRLSHRKKMMQVMRSGIQSMPKHNPNDDENRRKIQEYYSHSEIGVLANKLPGQINRKLYPGDVRVSFDDREDAVRAQSSVQSLLDKLFGKETKKAMLAAFPFGPSSGYEVVVYGLTEPDTKYLEQALKLVFKDDAYRTLESDSGKITSTRVLSPELSSAIKERESLSGLDRKALEAAEKTISQKGGVVISEEEIRRVGIRSPISPASYPSRRAELSEVPATPHEKMTEAQKKAPPKIGDVFYDSWGYDQTQNDFVKIVGFTPSGKTAIVRMVGAKQVTGSTVAPTEPFGPKFKLKIRGGPTSDYGPSLVGSYPFVGKSGESDEAFLANKRRGYFSKYTNEPVYETPAGFGH